MLKKKSKNLKDFNNLSKKELEALYNAPDGSAPKIAFEFNINEATVRKKLKSFSIPRHTTEWWKAGKTAHNKAQLKGRKFGRLTVQDYSHSEGGGAVWRCRCDCENKTVCFIRTHSLLGGLTKSCGCLHKEKITKSECCFEDLSTGYFNKIKTGAKKRNLEFNLTPKQLWELFIQQNKKCYYSGVDIVLVKPYNPKIQTASLDRKDSKLGYEINNVKWVHKDVNIIKNNLSEQELLFWCEKIISHFGLIK